MASPLIDFCEQANPNVLTEVRRVKPFENAARIHNALTSRPEKRALIWMETHRPATVRALALDEIYANDRQGAYLNAVDVHSGAVWASEGP